MEPILVTGGTGTLGSHIVSRLQAAGHDVRVLSRQPHADTVGVHFVTGDLLGTDLTAAVDGVSVIVHCAGKNKGDEVATQNLVDAASRAGRPHLVYVSVVGADRIPVTGPFDRMMFSYFDMKRKAELVVESSGLPWTTLRATQFYELMLVALRGMTKLPAVPVPSGISFQPVDSDDVAAYMVDLALGPPSGLVPDIGGPRLYTTRQLIRGYLMATGQQRRMFAVNLPGEAARALREGANVTPGRAAGRRTWEDFLAEHLLE
jgi:uncharacterized protein YbjT (DUF2867 family)